MFLPYVNKIYRTIIHCKVENADTYAPEIMICVSNKFIEIFQNRRDQFDMTFETLTRIANYSSGVYSVTLIPSRPVRASLCIIR